MMLDGCNGADDDGLGKKRIQQNEKKIPNVRVRAESIVPAGLQHLHFLAHIIQFTALNRNRTLILPFHHSSSYASFVLIHTF